MAKNTHTGRKVKVAKIYFEHASAFAPTLVIGPKPKQT